ncbi:hypothetical protein EV182_003770, partial [Spiromyces aspiralis]
MIAGSRIAGLIPARCRALAAQAQTHKEFEQNRSLDDPKKIAKAIKHANEVEQVILRLVVQATRSGDDQDRFS